MPLSNADLYRVHVTNLRAVSRGLEQSLRPLRTFISNEEDIAGSSQLMVYLLLLGAWAECRLRKLLYEPNGFDDNERVRIQGNNASQIDQWLAALEIGFQRRYIDGKDLSVTDKNVPRSAWHRYVDIKAIVEKDLRSIIEVRNKLAHGQWVRPLNNAGTEIAQNQLQSINTENALTAQLKHKILEYLSRILHDLVAGEHAFERDFDKHIRNIITMSENVRNRSYADWKKQQIDKRRRGLAIRDANIKG